MRCHYIGVILGIFTLLQGCQRPHETKSTLVDRGAFMLDVSHKGKAVNERVRFLVLHYTAGDLETSMKVLTGDNVSSHYLIPAHPSIDSDTGKPIVFQLVKESQRAWHAGRSSWGGRTNLNDTSIGIEQENLGFAATSNTMAKTPAVRWYPYRPEQINLLIKLSKQIVERYQIQPINVVGHSDIAPLRKQDPGPLFPWKKLAEAGVGAWPDEESVIRLLAGRSKYQAVNMTQLLDKLARYGYLVTPQMTAKEQKKVVAAFQMHFRPSNIDGLPDAETEAIVDALLLKYAS